MSRTHYQHALAKCREVLAALIAEHGRSALTPGIMRKAMGDAMPKNYWKSGMSIDWGIAMDDVMKEMEPGAKAVEQEGLF